MKLAKLLGVGTSFFGGGKTASYRLNQRGSLPKFNEGKNPFAPKAPAVAPETPAEKIVAPAAAPAPKAPAAYVFKPAGKPVGKPAEPPPAKVARPGWTARLNPFRAPEPTPAPCAVQPELSLDGVKVVHNDLADADVEVVPVKARVQGPVPTPMLAPARQAWEYLGESLLKSS